MRTTVDIKPEHKNALLALAARRGEEGLSGVLAEAIEQYLSSRSEGNRIEELLSLKGCLSLEEAEQLRAEAKAIRENWR